MKTPAGILLGGNKLNLGILDWFQAHGLKAIVVDWNREPELKGDLNLQIDVKDSPRVVAALEHLGDFDVRVAYTSIDVAVPTAVAIHRRYGLRTPAGTAYDAPLTKAQMTATWQKNGLLNRFSLLIPPDAEPLLAEAARGREVIVKPNLSSSSRGITILPPGVDESSLHAAYLRAQKISFDGQVIVEEFFLGREFTVEMLGDAEGRVAVYAISVKSHTAHAGSNKVANKLHFNSVLYPDETYQRIADYGRRCYQSLGLNCSLGHLEILMREDGLLSPVEIGARSSGFIVSHLAGTAAGRNFFDDYVQILQGGSVAPKFHQSPMSSLWFFYDLPPGRPCRRVTNLLEHLPAGIGSFYSDRAAIQPGRVYETIDDDTGRYGHEILHGPRDLLTVEIIESAERRMLETMFGKGDQ